MKSILPEKDEKTVENFIHLGILKLVNLTRVPIHAFLFHVCIEINEVTST